MILRSAEGDLLDLAPLGQVKVGGRPPPIAWIQRVEPLQVEVVQHVTDPVGTGEGDPGDLADVHGLGAEQYHLRSPPGHHRPGVAPHDAQQPVALLVADLSHRDSLGYPASSTTRCRRESRSGSLQKAATYSNQPGPRR